MTEGENKHVLYLSEISNNPLQFLSLLLPSSEGGLFLGSLYTGEPRNLRPINIFPLLTQGKGIDTPPFPSAPLCKGSWIRRKAETEGLFSLRNFAVIELLQPLSPHYTGEAVVQQIFSMGRSSAQKCSASLLSVF
ncbi:MAG: hypothetical protein ACI39E_07715, partial [Acutalibacteraceae bacterium]